MSHPVSQFRCSLLLVVSTQITDSLVETVQIILYGVEDTFNGIEVVLNRPRVEVIIYLCHDRQ